MKEDRIMAKGRQQEGTHAKIGTCVETSDIHVHVDYCSYRLSVYMYMYIIVYTYMHVNVRDSHVVPKTECATLYSCFRHQQGTAHSAYGTTYVYIHVHVRILQQLHQ